MSGTNFFMRRTLNRFGHKPCVSRHRQPLYNNKPSTYFVSTRYFSDETSSYGTKLHETFQEQLKELEGERNELFGSKDRTSSTSRSSSHSPSSQSHESSEHSTALHQSFQDQLKELEEERIELFGTNKSTSSPTSSPQHEMELTIDEMNQEREALYAFTQEEKTAWGSSEGSPTISSDLLHAVKKAREAKAIYEKSMQEDVEKKAIAIAEEAGRQQELEQLRVQTRSVSSSLHEEFDARIGNEGDMDWSQPFTHLNANGDQVNMVDVGHKNVSRRVAVARSSVVFPPEVMEAFGISSNKDGNDEMVGKKGPIFSTARLAGIMGAKRTSDLIPLCHPLPLDKVHIDIRLEGNRALIECECCVTHKTGVEMEALTGASIAALTIYDMVKAVSHRIRIENTELVTKEGGKRNIQDGIEVK